MIFIILRKLIIFNKKFVKQTFQYKSGKIRYSVRGNGKVIFLLHGYLESAEVWDIFAKKLSDKFRVLTVDLPGHGESDIYGEIHSMEFMAEAIKALMEYLGFKKIVLAGHSLGGYVTLAFLELFPDSLSGYCLLHSQPFADTPEALEKRRREIAIVKAGRKNLMYPDNIERMYAESNLEKFPAALKRSKEIASGIQGEGIIAVLNGMMARPSRLRFMEEGRVPCLWILGSMDKYIAAEPVLEKVKLPSNAKVVLLQNSGHLGFIEEEEKTMTALQDFVNRLNF